MIWDMHRGVSLGTLIVYLLSLIHPFVLLGDTPKDLVLRETVSDEFSRAAWPGCADEVSLEHMVRETAQAIAVCGRILHSLPNGASLRRDFKPHLHELPGRLAALHDRCNALLTVQEREEGPRADRGQHREHLREKLANWYAQTRELLMELREVREPERAHHLLDALRQEVISVVHSGATIPSSGKKVLPASRRPRSRASFATGSPHEDVHRKYAAKGASQIDAELLVVPAVESFPAVLALYQQIRNGLRYEPYYGSRKGGDATIAEGGGNDFDTAAALVNGLGKIHIDARYVYGTVHIPAEDVMNWVGGADTAEVALTILEKSGIPAEGLPEAGPYTTISMEHLWVEACLPSSTTGTDPNLPTETEAACEWRALDPSFKLYEYVPGIQWDQFNAQYPVDVFLPVESMNLNFTKGYASGLNGALLGEELFRRADALKAYLGDEGYSNPTPGDVLGYREIIPDTSSDLPASLPYEMVSVLWRSPEIPDEFRDAMTIDWYKSSEDDTPSLSRTLYLDEIGDKVLSLYYKGSTNNDIQQLAIFDGSNYRYTAVRAVLQLGTQVLGTSETGNFMGSREHLAVTYDLANGSQSSYDVDISAGSYYVFGFDLGRIPLSRIERRMADLRIGLNNVTDVASYTALFSPEIMGNTLALLADGYYMETAGLLDQQAGIEHIIRVNQVKQGLFKWTLDVSYIFGIPLGVKGFGRPSIDLRRSKQSVFSAAGNSEAEMSFRVIAGVTGSYMEGQIIEQTFGHPALSTIHVFKLANDAGMKIHVIDQSNIEDKLIWLNQFSTIKEMIAEEVGKGKLVIIPEGEVSLAGSQYSGMAVIDPNDGSGLYWIFNYLTAAGGLSAIGSPTGPLLLFLLKTIFPAGFSAPYLSMGVWLPIGFALATLGYPLLGLAAVGLAAWAGYNQFSNLFNGLFDPIISALGNLPGGSGAVPPASGSRDTGTAQNNRMRHLLSQMTLSQTLETQMRSVAHRASGLSRPDPYALHPVRDYLIQAVVDNDDQFSHFLETFQSTYGGEIFSSLRSDFSDEQLVELAIDCVDFRSLYELKEYLQALPAGQAFFEAFVGRACSDSSYAALNQVKNWPETVQNAFEDWLAIEYPSRMNIPQSDWLVHNARQLGDKSVRSTSGVAVDANGVVYLTDSGSEIVSSLIDKSPKYGVTFTFGGPGTEPKAFKAPHGIAVSSTGTVYVADTGNHRVQVFDTLGNVLNIVGEPGNAAGQLLSPRGLCLGRSGELYVADTGNHRICVFDTDGAFVREFGGYGAGAGNLKRPQGVAVDEQGFVYVADTGNHRIVKFTTEGDWLWSVGSMGYAQGGEFITPRGISIGEEGHVYVCDTYTYRIQEFDTDGEFLNAVTDAQFLMPADLAFNPANDSRFVTNDGGNTQIYRDDWKRRFYFYGSKAWRQWVDFAYREGQQGGAVRIVEFIVTEEVLQPKDFNHYIKYVQGEYHFATQDLLYWSLGSKLIHPQIQAEILEALSGDRLVLEIRIASAIEDPLSPELVALDGTTIPAYDWLSGNFMGNVLVDLHVE